MPTYLIAFAHGCHRADADVSLIAKYMEVNGYAYEPDMGKADIVLVSGCSFDKAAEYTSRKLIASAMARAGAGSRVILVGCIAHISREMLLKAHGESAALVPPRVLHELDRHIGARVPFEDFISGRYTYEAFTKCTSCREGVLDALAHIMPENAAHRARKHFSRLDRLRIGLSMDASIVDKLICRVRDCLKLGFVRQESTLVPSVIISKGCLGDCSYCAIRFACGSQRSFSPENIEANLDRCLEQGRTTVALIAQDVGCYGMDIGTNIAELLGRLLSRQGLYRLVLTDFNPRWLIAHAEPLLEVFARYKNRIDSLVLPVQSGSDAVLGRMNRHYTSGEVSRILDRLPRLRLSTHMIVGFPGETEEDFRRSLGFLERHPFDEVLVFKYDDRDGTPSSDFPDKISEKEKRRRLLRMNAFILGKGRKALSPFLPRPLPLGGPGFSPGAEAPPRVKVTTLSTPYAVAKTPSGHPAGTGRTG
jgi:tRNA A37 methylthiotransferase MiaB